MLRGSQPISKSSIFSLLRPTAFLGRLCKEEEGFDRFIRRMKRRPKVMIEMFLCAFTQFPRVPSVSLLSRLPDLVHIAQEINRLSEVS